LTLASTAAVDVIGVIDAPTAAAATDACAVANSFCAHATTTALSVDHNATFVRTWNGSVASPNIFGY
jgi:hypothetical protein